MNCHRFFYDPSDGDNHGHARERVRGLGMALVIEKLINYSSPNLGAIVVPIIGAIQF